MSLKHTPGKWELCDRGDYSDFDGMSQVILGNDMRIGVVHSYDDEGESNARLIAAAPEMLKVLIDFCRDNCNDCEFTCDDKSDIITFCGLKDAKQVIEKATGMTIEEVLKCH